MLLFLLALFAGFAVLVFSGDYLINGATALARRAGVPALVVGLTIVACGTSAPELFVSIQAVFAEQPALSLGNIVGSNIANVLLVLGIPALIAPFRSEIPKLGRNAFVGLAATVALVVFSLDGRLGPLDGLAMLTGLVVYLLWQWRRATGPEAANDPLLEEMTDIDEQDLPQRWWVIWGFIILGGIGLPIGANFIVWGASNIGLELGVRPEFIGLTVVAFGTSLPELAASVIAATRRHAEVAIGNVIGSNIFNILAVGGAASVAATFAPGSGAIPVPDTFMAYDYRVVFVVAVILWVIAIVKPKITRTYGVAFLLAYLLYIVFLGRIEQVW